MSKKDLAWCLDTLIPGVYLWAGDCIWSLGGSTAEDSHPYTIQDGVGFAIILPNLWNVATPFEFVRS